MSWTFKRVPIAELNRCYVLCSCEPGLEVSDGENQHFVLVGQLSDVISTSTGALRHLLKEDQIRLCTEKNRDAMSRLMWVLIFLPLTSSDFLTRLHLVSISALGVVNKRASQVNLMPLSRIMARLSLTLDEETNKDLSIFITALSKEVSWSLRFQMLWMNCFVTLFVV